MLHYAAYTLPVLFTPGTPRHVIARPFRHKLFRARQLGEAYGFLQLMIYHLQQEERFLARLAELDGTNWSPWEMESGYREVRSMGNDLGRYIAAVELREDRDVEEKLKNWLREHPGVKFKAYGERMTRKDRRELQAWRKEVENIKRQHTEAKRREAFLEKWKQKHGVQSAPYQQPGAGSLKRFAKRLRKKRLGRVIIR